MKQAIEIFVERRSVDLDYFVVFFDFGLETSF